MKLRGIIFTIIASGLICASSLSAQNIDEKLDLNFVLGLNIGATTPIPVPNELDITGYNPKINPKIGANLAYYFNRNFGIGTGLTIDWKGMNVDTKVSDVHLTIDVPNVGPLTGYVTGRNTTKVNTFYLTQPIYGIYRFNPKWQTKLGFYMSEMLSRSFKGDVTNVKIVVEKPIQQEKEIPYGTLDYSKDVHKIDVGVLAGGEFRLNDHFGFFADFTWALNPYFSRKVPMHFTMRNVYLSLGATYRL